MAHVDDLKAQGKLDIDYERLWQVLQHDSCFELYSEDGDVCLRTWDDNPIMVVEVSGDVMDIPYCREVGDLPRLIYDFVAAGGNIDSITDAIKQYGDGELAPIYTGSPSKGSGNTSQGAPSTFDDSSIDYDALYAWISASRENVVMSDSRTASLRQFGGSPAFVCVNDSDGFETEQINSADKMREYAQRFYSKGGTPDNIKAVMS